jgi:hypothetical protein
VISPWINPFIYIEPYLLCPSCYDHPYHEPLRGIETLNQNRKNILMATIFDYTKDAPTLAFSIFHIFFEVKNVGTACKIILSLLKHVYNKSLAS